MSEERRKIEILADEKPVPAKEIESFMDFDSVLNEYNNTKNRNRSNGWWITGVVFGLLMLGTGAYFFTKGTKEIAPVDSSAISIVEERSAKKHQEVLQKDSVKIVDSKKLLQDKELIKEKPEVKQKEVRANFSKSKNNNGDKLTTEHKKEEASEGAAYSYVEAVPVAGLENLYAYFSETLNYPEELKKDSVEGTVLVSFAILKDSTIGNIKIVKSLGEKFDEEAIRIIKNMPKWSPAMINNTPVSSKLSIPLNFNIDH